MVPGAAQVQTSCIGCDPAAQAQDSLLLWSVSVAGTCTFRAAITSSVTKVFQIFGSYPKAGALGLQPDLMHACIFFS
jgi:hypothetical protein